MTHRVDGAVGAVERSGPESNAYAYLRYLASSPLVRLDLEPDCALLSAPTRARPYNTVFAATFAPDGLERRLREVARIHASKGLDAVWWLGPAATPAGLARSLAHAGFRTMPSIQLMSAPLTARIPAPEGAGSHSGARVVRVRCESELADFVSVHRAAYEMSEAEADFTRCVWESLPLTEEAPLRHFLVKRGAEVLSAASVFSYGGVGGLYNVATIASARRRGHGLAVSRAALADSRARGLRTMTLGAEPGAVEMYRRLGFVVTGELARAAVAPAP
ncbi:GNAT family N-acetyltransferase [Streptomyces sp. NPDC002911]